MHVVIAPDKFKGSLSAAEAARALAAPLQAKGWRVTEIPMADGGEGTVEAALAAGYERVSAPVSGPRGERIEADYAFQQSSATAVIEMALASGLAMTSASDDDARYATSRGTGELIAHALDAGARRIILGVGGSASTDGGAGMMAALGLKLLDDAGQPLPDGGISLAHLAAVDASGLHPAIDGADFVLAADVDNPLRGEVGAAAVYGPQKGAEPGTVTELDDALGVLDSVLTKAGLASEDAAAHPGAGAAGGVGYAAIALLGAHREAGVDVVLELTDFDAKVTGADLVITGEGSLDEQSLHGKTPVGVAQAAARRGVPTIAVAGRTTLTREQVQAAGIEDRFQILDIEPDPKVAMSEAGRLLAELGEQIATQYTQEK